MTRPGFYRISEKEPPELGDRLSSQELLKLPTRTRVVLHTHLHDDPLQQLVGAARKNNNVLSVIRKTRDGHIDASDIVEHHTGHDAADAVTVAMHYIVSLFEPTGNKLPRGRATGSRLSRPTNLPVWLNKSEKKKRR